MRYVLTCFLLFFGQAALACPNCYSKDSDGNNLVVILCLGIFILLIYIPMFLLFRKAHQFKAINSKNLE